MSKELIAEIKTLIEHINMPKRDFSVRAIYNNCSEACFCYDKLDYTPSKLVVGNSGNSINDAIERALLASGNITRDQWERLKGIQYDVDDDDDENFDDDSDLDLENFEQSKFADYEVPSIPESEVSEAEPTSEPKKTSKKSKESPEKEPEADPQDPTLPLE